MNLNPQQDGTSFFAPIPRYVFPCGSYVLGCLFVFFTYSPHCQRKLSYRILIACSFLEQLQHSWRLKSYAMEIKFKCVEILRNVLK